MTDFPTLRHESIRLQAIRLAHIMYTGTRQAEPVRWSATTKIRDQYATELDRRWDKYLSPYCLLKASIDHVYFLNPADLARWGGESLPWPVGQFQRSFMMPTTMILTACSDEDIDAKVRDALSMKVNDRVRIEVLSWFGYQPADDTNYRVPFRSCRDDLADYSHLALLFAQKMRLDAITSIKAFFDRLSHITCKSHAVWTPLIVGLLKGNIDGFVLLGRKDASFDRERRRRDAEELAAFLADRKLRETAGTFWNSITPVSLYTGGGSDQSLNKPNIELLPSLTAGGARVSPGKGARHVRIAAR